MFEKCYSDMRHDACLGHTVAEIIVNQKTKRLTVNFVGLSVFKSHHLKNEHRAFIKKNIIIIITLVSNVHCLCR